MNRLAPIAVVVAALVVAGCATNTSDASSDPDPTSSSPSTSAPATTAAPPAVTPSPPANASPRITRITDAQWEQIVRANAWRPGCPVGQNDLRRLEINHYDYDGDIQRGVMVAHRDTVESLAEIFTELFDDQFPINRMRPVEEYDGDVTKSLRADNTSAYNCRRPDQINAPVKQSPHANGRAVDINPYRNPWLDLRCDCWQPSAEYAKATKGQGVIREGSPVIKIFTSRGWVWQNIKVPDYMHFDTGYPSAPLRSSGQ
jgi:hypothetical protein